VTADDHDLILGCHPVTGVIKALPRMSGHTELSVFGDAAIIGDSLTGAGRQRRLTDTGPDERDTGM
jgi:hypothetical protein